MPFESQKYFKDYEIKSVVSPDGKKVKTVRIYTGDIYRLNVDRCGWIRTKLEFSAIYLIMFSSCVAALLLDITANKNALMSIAPICTMLLFCYGLRGLIQLLTSEQNMTKYCYEQFKGCMGTSSYFLILTFGVSVAEGIGGSLWFGRHGESYVLWILYTFFQIIALLLSLFLQHKSKSLDFLYFEGKKTKTEEKQSDQNMDSI